MVAAQMVGAMPVPLYQDAVAEEMAYVLEHCGARFVIAGDQEQVDKVIEVQDRCTSSSTSSMSIRAGCGNTTTPTCTP
jgi:long-chain acyl-CoA synthetase